MKWCMLNNKGLETPASIWLRTQDSTKQGANHDGVNVLYVQIPPADLLTGLEVEMIYNNELAEDNPAQALLDLIGQAVRFMLSDSSNILTASSGLWELMYKTTYHRLWCQRYDIDDLTLFESDFLSVFGSSAGSTTTAQASAMIKQYFTG